MKTDLSRPIQGRDDESHAEHVRDTPDGKHIIEWQHKSGDWFADAFSDWAVDEYFKNTPPEPRKVKVWVVWHKDRDPDIALNSLSAMIYRKQGFTVTEQEIEEPTL